MIREVHGACTLEIRHFMEWESCTNRIENRRQINDLLGDSAFDRREPADCSSNHSNDTETYAAQSTDQCDRTHPPADVHQLIYFAERCVEDHRIGCFRGDVACHPDRISESSRLHRGSIINTVTDEQCLATFGFLSNDRNFFFRTLARVYFGDSNDVRQIANFQIAVARNEEHAVDVMAWAKVIHKAPASGPDYVAKPKRRGICAIDENYALKARRCHRQRQIPISYFVSARDPYFPTRHPSAKRP